MKRLSRLLTFLLALLLLLAGCSKSPVATDDGSRTDWHNAQIHPGTITDEGYYYLIDHSYLYFTDTSNGVSVCLCTRTGCLHEKEPDVEKKELCEAALGFPCALWFWDDHLYYIADDGYGPHIYRRDASGMDLSVVADLSTQYIKEKRSVSISCYIQQDNYLYYLASVDPAVPDEMGLAEFCYIGRVDMNTYKDEELLTGNLSLQLCAANQDGFLFCLYDIPQSDYDDPNYREELSKMESHLKYWDCETGEISTELSATYKDFSSVSAVAGDKVYYRRGGDAVTVEYDMTTGACREVNDKLRQINGHYAFRQEEAGYTLFDLRTGEKLPVELKADYLSVYLVSDKAVVLATSTLRPDGNSYESKAYSYVMLNSLADGLQEADLLPVYTDWYQSDS